MAESPNIIYNPLVIYGPSGVGKGTIVKTLISRREDVVESVSCTTRKPREGEIDGKHYFFLSKEEFLRHEENGQGVQQNKQCVPEVYTDKCLKLSHFCDTPFVFPAITAGT